MGRLSFLAACAFALAVVLNTLAGALFATLGLVLLLLSFADRAETLSRFFSASRLTAALVAMALVSAIVPDPLNAVPRSWLIAAPSFVVIAFAVADLTREWTRRHPIVAGATIIVAVLAAGISLIQAVTDSGIDVVQLHRQAAAALARGANPYGAAVSVPNGAPGAPPGSMIVGYPYPPVAGLVYTASTWLWGDPRWASLASWTVLAACGLALCRARRRDADSALPFLLLAVLPGWPMMLQTGWTEMLSAALVALAALTWNFPVLSGIAVGAALGSKQYFVVAVPLLVLFRGDGWRRRNTVAFTTAMLSVLAGFVWSPSDAWRSMVLFHAQTPARTDSSNLVGVLGLLGVDWSPPVWIGLGVSLTLVSVLARRAPGPAGFCRAMAAGLAAFFLFSSQAMPNYWFLLSAIAALGSQAEGWPTGQPGYHAEAGLNFARTSL